MAWKNDQVSEVETAKILALARECLAVEGDYVELGCYRGDTSLLLADILRGTGRQLWLYDSFEGLPQKEEADRSAMGESFQAGALAVSKREVKERFLRAGLKVPKIKKGWFEELDTADLPERIALAFLDGDFYQSIRDSLRLVQDKMAPGGVIVVHDFANEALPGVTRAVEEWLREREAGEVGKIGKAEKAGGIGKTGGAGKVRKVEKTGESGRAVKAKNAAKRLRLEKYQTLAIIMV